MSRGPRPPQAMTLSHDRLVLQRKDGGIDEPVVLVRCPHTIGLCFEGDGFLSMLPCPCNERSEVLAELVPRDTAHDAAVLRAAAIDEDWRGVMFNRDGLDLSPENRVRRKLHDRADRIEGGEQP